MECKIVLTIDHCTWITKHRVSIAVLSCAIWTFKNLKTLVKLPLYKNPLYKNILFSGAYTRTPLNEFQAYTLFL